MYCPSFPEAPTMQTLIVCVPERPGHSVSSDSPLDAAIDEGLRGLGAGSDSMRTTPAIRDIPRTLAQATLLVLLAPRTASTATGKRQRSWARKAYRATL